MDFNQVVQTRKSVKRFKSEDIPENKLESMLNAARVAPSWGNRQCWKFVLVRKQDIKKKIAEAMLPENSAHMGVEQAPLIIVVCAEPESSAKSNNQEYYLVDSAIAMDHLILAAHNEGLGTCWVGKFDENKIKQLLKIPEHYRVVALTPVGYPDESPDTESRRTINEIGYLDGWGNYLH
ncbi:MAG: nitroreductase family protein [Bacillota bacterium]